MPKKQEKFGDEVVSIRYRHSEDGQLYEHKFETVVELWAMSDGSLGIISPEGRNLLTER